jgi:hypothetical protein
VTDGSEPISLTISLVEGQCWTCMQEMQMCRTAHSLKARHSEKGMVGVGVTRRLEHTYSAARETSTRDLYSCSPFCLSSCELSWARTERQLASREKPVMIH